MKNHLTEKALLELKEKFKSMPRVEREKMVSEILIGTYLLLQQVAENTAKNNSLAAVAARNLNGLVDSKVTDALLSFLVESHNYVQSIKGDLRDARVQDIDCNSLCNRINQYFNSLNSSFNKVYFFKEEKEKPTITLKRKTLTLKKDTSVVHVDFKTKKIR